MVIRPVEPIGGFFKYRQSSRSVWHSRPNTIQRHCQWFIDRLLGRFCPIPQDEADSGWPQRNKIVNSYIADVTRFIAFRHGSPVINIDTPIISPSGARVNLIRRSSLACASYSPFLTSCSTTKTPCKHSRSRFHFFPFSLQGPVFDNGLLPKIK